MKFGIDKVLADTKLIGELENRRVALMGHPASVTSALEHSLDALVEHPKVNLTAGFGPQHGMLGDLQDNMEESDNYVHPKYKIPIFSLYGEVRRPTSEMLETFDVLLLDLQDVGTRIYTYLTTMIYLMEDIGKVGKEIWILDRPNPAGRAVEGFTLTPEWESFVGAAAIPIRHGLTLGEMANWYRQHKNLDVKLKVVPMEAKSITWPQSRVWINPSPNIPRVTSPRSFPGTVLLEGTNLSEGRGTTVPLEIMGAPDIDADQVLAKMSLLAPDWLKGCKLRTCFFRPTFHKHVGQTCHGIQIHTEDAIFDESTMRPYRLVSLFFKAIRDIYPDYQIWRDFHYEYEKDRLAIDLINGGDQLRLWVDDSSATVSDFDAILTQHEQAWSEVYRDFFLY